MTLKEAISINRNPLYFLLGLHVLFFAYQLIAQRYWLNDSWEYLNVSSNLIGFGTTNCGNPAEAVLTENLTKRPPGYPLFLMLLFNFPPLIALLQMVLSLLSTIMLFAIFEVRQRAAWLTAFTFLGLPAIFIYPQLIMAETTLCFYIVLAIFFLNRFLKHDQTVYLALMQASILGAILTKPTLYLFVPINLIFMASVSFKKKRMAPIFYSLLLTLSVLCYMSWNYQRTGVFHFSSIQAINLLDYNTYYFLTEQRGLEYATHFVDSTRQVILGEPFKRGWETIHDASLGVLMQDLFSYGVFHLKGTVRFFIDPGRFEIAHFFRWNQNANGFLHDISANGLWSAIKKIKIGLLLLLVLLTMIKTWVFLIGAWGAFRSFGRYPWIITYVTATVLYLAVITGPLGASRFYYPALMLVVVIGATQLATRKEKYRPKQI